VKSVRVTSLGSGSKGNATVVEYGHTRLLIDSGFSCKALQARLAQRDLTPSDITAILVTHEHSDHFNGVPTFANRFQTPVWMTHGTSLHHRAEKLKTFNILNGHEPFAIGDIQVNPVLVPHDSREACQFTLKAGDHKIGILTDLGHITPFVSGQYQDCAILLLEFNHDVQMLREGRYPASLKARVGGSLGHLSNDQAKEFLQVGEHRKLQHLAAMHLSEENNCSKRVQRSIEEAKLADQVNVLIAHQDDGFDWISIE